MKTKEELTAVEYIQLLYPEMDKDEIEEYDRALDDYLNICMDMFYRKEKEGDFDKSSNSVISPYSNFWE